MWPAGTLLVRCAACSVGVASHTPDDAALFHAVAHTLHPLTLDATRQDESFGRLVDAMAALAKKEKEGAKKPATEKPAFRFGFGMEVEVRGHEPGFEGSWYAAEIIALRD